ncbi:MAG: nickel-binding protein [Bacteroidota bacterium]
MPIYMDVHILPGVKAKEVAEAHLKDLMVQNEHVCKCMTYWVDEKRGNVFCLIEAPTKEAVSVMHNEAHGLIPNKVIEVDSSLVESFLGRINDPEDAVTDDGLKVFSDASFRILLVTGGIDPVLLQHQLGKEKANQLLNEQNKIIREELAIVGAREVEHVGNGLIGSFTSLTKAITCALNIQKKIPDDHKVLTGFKMVLNGGEPVENSDQLFGDTLQLANQLCSIRNDDRIIITSVVKEQLTRDSFLQEQFITLSPQDETFVTSLFNNLAKTWQDADFSIADFCKAMAMSKSQLYRKIIAIWGVSPNVLLNDFRLERAKELLKKQRYNVAQTTFDAGFSSPSYFTKCFKKKFNLLPAAYLNLLQ